MFQKIINSIQPFALTIVILAGANLAGWIKFTNNYVVGVATVFCGVLFTISHIVRQLSDKE